MGLTVFLITHDLDSLYATCDRVAVLAEKRVIAVGTIPELLATEHPWIQDYFNGPRGRAATTAHVRAAHYRQSRWKHAPTMCRRAPSCHSRSDNRSSAKERVSTVRNRRTTHH